MTETPEERAAINAILATANWVLGAYGGTDYKRTLTEIVQDLPYYREDLGAFCPICDEYECDQGCPLASVRRAQHERELTEQETAASTRPASPVLDASLIRSMAESPTWNEEQGRADQ